MDLEHDSTEGKLFFLTGWRSPKFSYVRASAMSAQQEGRVMDETKSLRSFFADVNKPKRASLYEPLTIDRRKELFMLRRQKADAKPIGLDEDEHTSSNIHGNIDSPKTVS